MLTTIYMLAFRVDFIKKQPCTC